LFFDKKNGWLKKRLSSELPPFNVQKAENGPEKAENKAEGVF
jgi:hypothetical protein